MRNEITAFNILGAENNFPKILNRTKIFRKHKTINICARLNETIYLGITVGKKW